MFIRPWVRVLLARMKNPSGWVIDEYRLGLVRDRGSRRYMSIWTANGWFWHMKIDRWEDSDAPRGLKFNLIERLAVGWQVRHWVKAYKRKLHSGCLDQHIDMQTELITKLTNLED